MRFDKPIGILLLLWPTYWALWLCNSKHPSLKIFIIFSLGVILTRAAGCIINDIADRNFDGHVARTKHRPIANGSIKIKPALILFCSLMCIAFSMVLLLNTYTIGLACIAALLATSYPFMKRFIHMPQAVLGLAFAWSIPMAYAASNNHIPPIAILLFIATAIWIIAYDTEYALTDIDDDLKIGLRSSAIFFGRHVRLAIGCCQITFLAILTYVGRHYQLGWPFYVGIIIASILLVYQQFLIANKRRDACFRAFMNNHWVGFSIFLGIVISHLMT
jgi:4-hydroxybenzoate polyprenyltransferase